ncbi:MAG: hypothetical protein CR997_04685 [Acidobacteria bacterium]|nr:MAG: hypothetical protein CR997_04685 [Acidobacteriota bacterium]
MYLTLAFLLIVLVVYVLFGGADFGGGPLEASLTRYPHLRSKLQGKLAPIWEANHVWLIAIVVILFVGFPKFFSALSEYLFVPLSLALCGIVLRGTFFTFRKYDPEPEKSFKLYSFLFRASSTLTPFCFGLIVASFLTVFPDRAEASFYDMYVAPWMTIMGLLCGLFVMTMFGFLAAIFFLGELQLEEERKVIEKRAIGFFVGMFITGGFVLAWGGMGGIVDISDASTPMQIALQVIALVCVPIMWKVRSHVWYLRLVAGVVVATILAGWFATQYPVFMMFTGGSELTVQNSCAPDKTLFLLNVGLVVVLLLVLPPLVYLYKVFHGYTASNK